MTHFSTTCTTLRLIICLKNTKVMYLPPPGLSYMEPNVFVNGFRMEVFETFVKSVSALSRDGSMDAEVKYSIELVSQAFRKLERKLSP